MSCGVPDQQTRLTKQKDRAYMNVDHLPFVNSGPLTNRGSRFVSLLISKRYLGVHSSRERDTSVSRGKEQSRSR